MVDKTIILFQSILSDAFNLMIQFIVDNVFLPLTISFFTVVGGVMPIAILIYLFSKKEKKRLLAHAEETKKSLASQEKLFDGMAKTIEKSISPHTPDKNLEQFKQLVEAQNMIEDEKRFIKYAENYDFISAVGHVLRVSNYMPSSIREHKEIAKNMPHSSSSDT